ncbi:hypothetical protein [Streptomyces sudanensis]|uniref:hypothetical protein n=1 Tax=Streptomyces sudanensis TaxID=436397 RepID=UPI0020CD0576|nr:hypothetical protein [Streptomyces sudanensis]MCP9957545.1 hypothetical protein [Streptomyces sudanensis]MCP9986678.1 hypothetical protein [Streptomyces sudanensis]MCQ0001912.1 hypothetical protein [Streptomyces sudanensis]
MNLRNRFLLTGSTLPVVLAVVLSGCTTAEPASADEERSARRAQSALDATQEVKTQVVDAELKLLRKCMVDKGFTIFPEDGAASTRSKAPETVSPSVETAKKIGYGLDPRRTETDRKTQTSSDAFDRLPDSKKAAHTLAMYGPDSDVVSYEFGEGKVSIPRSGCMGEVRKALYGDLETYLRLQWTAQNTVNTDAAAELTKDSEVQGAATKWATCMKSSGYPGLKEPADARKAAAKDYVGIPPTQTTRLDAVLAKEVELATADATCAQSSRLNQTVTEARAHASAKVLAKHEGEIIEWTDLLKKALRNAQRLLGTS